MSPRAELGPRAGGLLPVILALVAWVAACEPRGAEPPVAAVVPASETAVHEGATSHGPPGATEETPAPPRGPAPPGLATVRGDPVQGRTGPGGAPFEVAIRDPGRAGHDRLIGRQSFEVSLRRGRGIEYPCGSCHRPGKPAVRPVRAEDAHRNVLPRHPDREGTPCLTCHAPDRVDQLVLVSGERVDLGHAYRLCGQCHYVQADAWAAGAHGKRLDGWRGRRVVMGCADCHDPHQPALEARIPFPGPRALPTRGRP